MKKLIFTILALIAFVPIPSFASVTHDDFKWAYIDTEFDPQSCFIMYRNGDYVYEFQSFDYLYEPPYEFLYADWGIVLGDHVEMEVYPLTEGVCQTGETPVYYDWIVAEPVLPGDWFNQFAFGMFKIFMIPIAFLMTWTLVRRWIS